jgi:RNA-binding protein Musashi
MADGDNFEEDIFADLYDDNDAAKPGAAPEAPAPSHDAPSKPQPEDDQDHAMPSMKTDDEQHDQAYDDDDDDDVDFNLGGGGGAAASSVMHQGPSHDDAGSPPSYGAVHKASAKEDG